MALICPSMRARRQRAAEAPQAQLLRGTIDEVARLTVPGRRGSRGIGHSTVLVELDGVRLLTDDAHDRPSRICAESERPVDPARLRDVDAVLVSHAHYDHLDVRSLVRLGRSLPVVLPAASEGSSGGAASRTSPSSSRATRPPSAP